MGKSIFVIDDYSINLFIAQMVIEDHGFFDKVTTFSQAEEALDFLVQNQNDQDTLPNVILLDLNMPVMNGWQFLDKFEKLLPCLIRQIDIYILSSSMDNRDVDRAHRYVSVNKFLSKPLCPEMLQDIMTTYISSAS